MQSRFFKLQELVPPEVFDRWGYSAWWFLQPRMWQALDSLRDYIDKPITVNDWLWGGNFKQSGLRTPQSGNIYNIFSQHSFGNACDIKVKGMTALQMYDWCLAHESLLISWGFTTIENIKDTPTWIHLDCRYTGNNKLLIVNA